MQTVDNQTVDDLPLCAPNIQVEDDRTGTSVETLRRAMGDNLRYIQGRISLGCLQK